MSKNKKILKVKLSGGAFLVGTAIAAIILSPAAMGKNDISSEKMSEKYEQAAEIKAKYALDGASLKTTPKDDWKDRIEVQVGNASDTEFIPKLKIARWDDEVNLMVKPKALEGIATKDKDLKFEGKKIKFETPKIDYHLYELIENEGGYEYEVIFKEKPAANKIEFSLETKGLDFFYQPELTQAEKDRGLIRPDNVVGSYAVYVSEKKINRVGGKEYKTGKFGHIYRPKITDSAGNWVWGELNVDADRGILTITVPQDFLDKAVYPIVVDPTFGYDSQGGSLNNVFNGNMRVIKATPASAGIITSISSYGNAGAADAAFKVGAYKNSDLSLVVGSDPSSNTNLQWHDFDVVDTAVTAVLHALVWWSGDSGFDQNAIYWDDTDVDRFYKSQAWGDWPDPIGDFTTDADDETYSIYVTYTTNAAPTNGAGSIVMDDTDNLYAQRQYYTGTSICSDTDGFADIDYCEFRLKQGAATRAIFRYDEDTNAFTAQSGSTEWDLDTDNSSATESGNDITITWKFMPQWDAVQEDDLEIELYAVDDEPESDTDTAQSDYVDVITDLAATFSIDDDRGNISQSITASGNVTYSDSALYPPNAEFTSVSVYDSANSNEGTDLTIVNGAWSVTFDAPAATGTDTYNLYVNMADADYTDGEETSPTDTFITDRIKILTLLAVNATILVGAQGTWYAVAELEYDNHALGLGDSFTLSGYAFSWDAGDSRFEATGTKSTPQTAAINAFDAGAEATYGITSGNINNLSQSIEWQTPAGGGGMPSEWYNLPAPPKGGFKVLINNGVSETNSSIITLSLSGGPDTERMAISNFSDFRDAGQEKYQITKEWNLCKGLAACPEGKYQVYVKFYAPWGTASEVVSDTIIKKPISKSAIGQIKTRINEISRKIADLRKQTAQLFEGKEVVDEVPKTSLKETAPPAKEISKEEIISQKEIPLEKEGLIKQYGKWLWQKIINFWQKIWPL